LQKIGNAAFPNKKRDTADWSDFAVVEFLVEIYFIMNYTSTMIRSFSDSRTEHAYHRLFDKRLPQDVAKRIYLKLKSLDSALTINDVRIPPSNHLELLLGCGLQRYSIRANNQWRICFTWKEETAEAWDVQLVDYH